MWILIELVAVAALALLARRFLAEPWRGRFFNLLKLYLTVRMVWLLLLWPVTDAEGGRVPAWNMMVDQLQSIDAATFWIFAGIGAAVRFAGVLASMVRWKLVLLGQNIELPFRHIFGAFLIGRAIGFFLPSTAGLDAYKLYDAARFTGRTVEVTAGTVLEKVLGVTGIFLTYLVALPFGISIFGDNGFLVASITVPLAIGIITALLAVLWFPGLVQWGIEHLPLPGKERLRGVVTRISLATAAYRNKKRLVLGMLVMSFFVHFFTAAMYFFMAIAVGAGAEAAFWPVVFGSSIQIFATVIGPTIGGIGIREAAQVLTLGSIIGVGAAAVSATLGFWIGEVPTLFGFAFWMLRGKDYRPAYSRVEGQQVDYEEAARRAVELETPEEKARREDLESADHVPPIGLRVRESAAAGFGAGIVAGLLIGVFETWVIAAGGFGEEAQVLWYGPLAYALILAGLCTMGGAVLGVLPMDRDEIRGWVPSLAWIATLVPLGLFITLFRLRRDVYFEQWPPLPVSLGVVGGFAALALLLFFAGRPIFRSFLGTLVRPLPALGLLAAFLIGGLVASSQAGPTVAGTEGTIPEELLERPNILLVMVDTLRADHLSCYGATEVETPHLCSLADEGGSLWQGFAHASWTKPATASLVSSTLPSTHNAMSKPAMLSEDVDLIAEVLQDAGYTTGGIVSNINLAPSFGFDQGYDEYIYLAPDYLAGAEESSSKLILYQLARQVVFRLKTGVTFGDFYQDSTVVNEAAVAWLDRNGDSRFFLFLHYMDPHDPYFPHPYDGTGIARVSNPDPDADEAAAMQALYRGEIEYLDGHFGELLAELKARGLYDNTLIALVADHGEEFQEHGGWWHGTTLYDEQIFVPLLIKWAKGRAPLVDDGGIARIIDVAPTLIARAGAQAPESMQGVDLAAGPRSPKDLEIYSEEDHEGNVLWSLRTADQKLIVANPGNPRGLAEREFYDVRSDPGEIRNLAGGEASADEARLEAHADLQRRHARGEAVSGGEVEMSRSQCEQLKNLGYIEDCSHL